MNDRAAAVPAGMRERTFSESDLPLAHHLINVYDEAMGGVKLALEDLRRFTRSKGFSWDRDSFGLVEEDLLVGFGMIWNNDPGSIPDFAYGVTRPGYEGRGIGTYLLDRIEARHDEVRAAHPEGPDELRVHVDLADRAAVALHEARGFKEIRRSYTMEATLGSFTPPSPLPGIDVTPVSEADLEVFHEALEESFEEHWGNVPETFEEFRRTNVERPDNRLDLWLLASDGEEAAGVMLGRLKDGVGWVDALGVRKPYRRKGLGRHLLQRALWLFQEEEVELARLVVDAQNASGAVDLYEGAGMRVLQVSATYGKG